MPRVAMVLIVLFVALALRETLRDRSAASDLPLLTADTPKPCCRVCKKGKGLRERVHQPGVQCTKASGCACKGSGSS
jgi:hypothetical protein